MPEANKILIINSFFCPDSIWRVQVSVPDKVDNPTPVLPGFEAATVEIWEEGVSIGKLQHIGKGNYTLNEKPKQGKKYKIQVSAEGYPPAAAESYVPDSVVHVTGAGVDWNNAIPTTDPFIGVYSVYPLHIDFIEPKGEGNFYYLSFYYYDSCSNINWLYPDRRRNFVAGNDPIIDPISKKIWYILFNDEKIEGKSYSLSMYDNDGTKYDMKSVCNNPPFRHNYIEYYADFQNVSPEMYRFISSYYIQAKNFTDPFAIYSNVYSNVKGGRGIFAGYTVKQVLIFKGEIEY